MKWIVPLAIVGVFFVLIVGVFFYSLNVKNQAIILKESYLAKEKTVQTAHDNMWKTIKQKFDVTDEYKSGFILSVQAVVEGRKGGALFKTVQENMPGLSPDLYKEVMATIEGKRDMLKREMDTEVDIARQYNSFVQNPYHSLFVDSTRIEPKIITSGKTSEAWSTGEDNDTSLRDSDNAPKKKALEK